MRQLAKVLACLELLGATDIQETHDDQVDFKLSGCAGFGFIRDGAFCGAVWIGLADDASIDYAEAMAWVELQGTPAGCEIEILDWESGLEIWVRFERALSCSPEAAATDPLPREVAALSRAWEERAIDPVAALTFVRDPGQLAPSRAWLLLGDEASWFSPGEIEAAREAAVAGAFDTAWYVSQKTEVGDLLFFYFAEPHEAIHFVARAACGPTCSTLACGVVCHRQCWVMTTPPVPIEPVTREQLVALVGETSDSSLTPEQVTALAAVVRPVDPHDAAELAWVLQPLAAGTQLAH